MGFMKLCMSFTVRGLDYFNHFSHLSCIPFVWVTRNFKECLQFEHSLVEMLPSFVNIV